MPYPILARLIEHGEVGRVIGQKVFEEAKRAEVTDKQGQLIRGPEGKPIRGLGCGMFPIPMDAAGGEYTVSVWVRADAPGATLKLQVQEWPHDPASTVGAVQVSRVATLTTSWQQVSLRYKPGLPGASSLDLKLFSGGSFLQLDRDGRDTFAVHLDLLKDLSQPLRAVGVFPDAGRCTELTTTT